MSDKIKHECGIAMLRLLKPLSYYKEKYGSEYWALSKMYLLMEKQHNRGQDGAGLVSIKFKPPLGNEYIFRERSIHPQPIKDLFKDIYISIESKLKDRNDGMDWFFDNVPFIGNLYLGHLRYGTYGKNSIHQCHPFFRKNNWMSRNLITAGNFNMTNVDELFDHLLKLGQHPREKSDNVTILERIGHFLDEEVDEQYTNLKLDGVGKKEASEYIENNIDIEKILKNSSKKWDGGYVIAGILGHGDSFVLRDPNGIRPAYYYQDDEILVVTSERPVIQTVFDKKVEDIVELRPGHALIARQNGKISLEKINEPGEKKSCSFERIYFSRGTDSDIYKERLELGRRVVPSVLKTINFDIANSVFSYIPNTAEIAYYGMIKGLKDYSIKRQVEEISQLNSPNDKEKLFEILNKRIRIEKIAFKDVKLRTFITQDSSRDELVQHVYDISYGTVKNTDNLVIIDDSIVRGTTLKKSIIKILDRLNPKQIIVVSSAPQIRYPDCYGIDMARLGDFVAFRAAIDLLKEGGMHSHIDSVYEKCKAQLNLPESEIINYVKEIYEPFSYEEISERIAKLVTDDSVKSSVKVIYQSVEDLHKSCPDHSGDWYFTGNYPTPGGMRVVCKSFVYYYEGCTSRAY